MTKRILVTQPVPEAAERVLEGFEVSWNRGPRLEPPELLARATGRHGILCLLTDGIGPAILSLPGLEAVSTVSVGYDHIDLTAAVEHGIVVTHTPDVLTETTADFAWALLMAVARRVVEGDSYVRRGRFQGWDPLLLLGSDVHGKCLGIVGMGRIGRAMARRAQGFDMRVAYYDPLLKYPDAAAVTLDELLAQADFVTLHVPLSESTHHLIGWAELARMKPTAYLVNTSRGPVVDEAALVQALSSGTIAGAGLDVFEREPRLEAGLAGLENVVLAPHIASASRETRERMAVMAAQDLKAVLEGRTPSHPVPLTGHRRAK
ncbi:MAG TPA: D-glycerate dehydrogenase [Clostridiales bacterium UBA8153]|nr:D-glycerate dehydrogenase [Clostridiales bacterium UBA8153]